MNVLIAGGGTGGHVFPGVAVAQELMRRDPQTKVLFVGTPRGVEVRAVPKAGFALELLPVTGLMRKSLRELSAGLLRLPVAFFRALRLVQRFRPDVAVSAGGYVAGPAVLAAWLWRVPCVVLEANAVPGLTTRLLSRLARRVVLALPSPGFAENKSVLLGNPVRKELVRVREQPYPTGTTPLRLFITGGSQGAKPLNDVMIAAAAKLRDFTPPLSVLHQTGPNDHARVTEAYRALGADNIKAVPFVDDMAQAYLDAHLVLCRSGGTVAELTVCGRPSILVPLPTAASDYQTANAKSLAAAGAGLFIPQREFTADKLCATLAELAANPARLATMARAAWELGRPDAAARIADVVAAEATHV